MSVSFFKHKKALIDAYKDVLDESSDTDWALFTYEGKDNELKVAGTGEDGLEELESEFNSSKIMYAFIRVKDPKTSLKKFIFLHFQGEGAPATRKGACANHVRDVERFFKGAHITINARSEDDVTPEQIMEHVKKASASTYAFDKKSGGGGYDEPSQPVGSVYKRTNAGAEISSTRNESYWAKQEREEEMRKKEEERKKNEERRMYAAEIKEREKESAQRRLEWEKAREREISEKVRATKLADDTSEIRRKEKEKWDADQRAYEAESNRGRKRSESIEKAAEAAHLVQKRDTNPKTLWEQRIQEANKPLPPPQRGPLRSSDRPIDTYQPPAAPEPEYHETFDEPEAVYEPEPAAYEPEPTAAYEPEPAAVYEPEPAYNEPEPESEYNVVPDPEPQQVYDEPAQNQISNNQYDQNQYQASNDDYQAHYDNPEDVQEPADNYAEVGDTGYRARALYDYQAADDTEITFDPDDIITNISMVDEGWWQGTAPDGKYGLFPANYVELME